MRFRRTAAKTKLFALVFLLFLAHTSAGQRYLADLDTSFIRDTVRPFLKKFDNLRISGYMQPQFQVAQSDGAASFEGGNFAAFSRSRFMLRRARIKIDYLLSTPQRFPQALFTFQIDATERGVIVRDMFIRVFETHHNLFSMTAGFFARPFGYEVNLGSSYRETPERGRMSQTLMPGERDLGAMLSFEPQNKKHPLYHLKWDAGFFNGQGASGTTDFDSHKDFISRISIKPCSFGITELSGGLSLLLGGWKNGTKYVYTHGALSDGTPVFVVDSSQSNYGTSSPRHYYGGDLQLKFKNAWGETELRGEHWFGTQPGTATSTANPGTLPTGSNGLPVPTYVRHFNGGFFYLMQFIGKSKHQLLLKYDWYDPNTKVKAQQIGMAGSNLTAADISYKTIGLGYVYYLNNQTKLTFYYDIVRNESTKLSGYTADLADNVFTTRLQFRF